MIKKFVQMFSSVRMQLAASVFVAIAPVVGLTCVVNQPWFWKHSPAWLHDYFTDGPWVGLAVGVLALLIAWFCGERFILRQVRALTNAARRLGKGDLSSRTGIRGSRSELGQLARVFDTMAESLQQRVKELERAHVEGQKLAVMAQKLAAFAQLNPNPTLELAEDGELTYFNDAALKLARSVRKSHPRDVLPPDIRAIVSDCLETGRSQSHVETKMDGRTLSWSFHPMLENRVVHCYVEDTTERLNLEAQLRQAQKMESVGQLAAGVAHDFNNMLTIIQGQSSLVLAKTDLPAEISDPIQSAYFAAERAAGLTRQLLMFSRRNTMQPRPLDLRETVNNMTKMLHRLMGETITLKFSAPDELPIILGDSGMLEQVVMNLSLNARDAMPDGGVLKISLDLAYLDQKYIETHPEAHVGSFVRLRVKDTGVGMDAATLAHLFEPFFTTKEIGQGTGLGLATVYGIVKQHDGWIEVSSNPGLGTTFNVFFPAGNGMAIVNNVESAPELPVAGGTETILIVEDEPVLREMTRTILESSGYQILEASSGRDALDVWNRRTGKINLLLTDMVMPEGVSGLELAQRLLSLEPGLKIIFTSGYSAQEVGPEVLARTRARFLQKPYSYESLAGLVRECLDKKIEIGENG
jgi:C4-dicarboxylate-specific signal transduction histidine kinase/ActR/RegA family two-component response regulator